MIHQGSCEINKGRRYRVVVSGWLVPYYQYSTEKFILQYTDTDTDTDTYTDTYTDTGMGMGMGMGTDTIHSSGEGRLHDIKRN